MSVRQPSATDARIALVASWFVVLVLCFQGVASMLSQVTDDLNTTTRALGVVSTLVCAGTFVLGQRATMRNQTVSAWWGWLIVVAAVAGFTVGAWLNAALAIGLLALVLSGARLAAVVVTSTAAMVAFMLLQNLHPIYSMWYLLVVFAIALLLYVLTRLAVTVGELLLARETVSRMRVDEERHRISRDLHDILGRSLVAVSLRVQTVIRILDRDPDAGRDQLEEIARMIADGQAQLRGLTRGQQVVGFAAEVEAARDLFETFRIRCEVDVPRGPLQPGVDDLGARVVRECVTNLLKHSRASTVEISLREESAESVLVVLNDGTRESRSSSGTGLADLAARVEESGGTMEAGHLGRDRFRVIARLRHTPARAGIPDAGPADTTAPGTTPDLPTDTKVSP